MSERTDSRSYHPVSSREIEPEIFEKGTKFAIHFKHLTSAIAGNRYNVGVSLEELPAGKHSNQFHFHMLEEEHIFVLDGSCTLRLGDERISMKAGDYVMFPAGRTVGHCLINETGEVCRYLIIGERNPNEVCVYPDSNKVQVRWLNERYDRRTLLDYWDGEPAD